MIVSREVAATTPPSRPPRSWNGEGEVVEESADDWDVYYERGRKPKESITKYEAARSEGATRAHYAR